MNYISEYLKAIENDEIITSKRIYKVYKRLADDMKIQIANIFLMEKKQPDQ